MVKTRINQFHRDRKATEHFRNCAMRLNVGTKFVTAKEDVISEKSVSFALKVKFLWQPIDLVVVLRHPFGKKRLFAGAFFVAEIAGNKSAANRKAGICGKDHVGQSRLR